MRRTLFTQDHDDFRSLVRDFLTRRVVPEYEEWRKVGLVPRELFTAMGELGIIGTSVPEEYGGGGQRDYRYNVVIQEETARAGVTLGGLRTHLDVVVPYFLGLADEAQRKRWLPGIASGELYTAIAMSEPGTGSDLAGIATKAVREDDHYILNGAKTFITGGYHADLIIVAARTSHDPDNRRAGMTLMVVEKGMPGFTVGRKLEKIGLPTQDTVELSFDQVTKI